jgi:hypothetical protein
MLYMRYVCDPRTRRISEQEIWEEILNEFDQCKNIDFAYPTQRFYNNMKEGKEEIRAENNNKLELRISCYRLIAFFLF